VVKTHEVAGADLAGCVKEIFHNVEAELDQLAIGQGRLGAGVGLRHPGLNANDCPHVIMESTFKLKSHEEWLNKLESLPLSACNELMHDDEIVPWNDGRWESLCGKSFPVCQF